MYTTDLEKRNAAHRKYYATHKGERKVAAKAAKLKLHYGLTLEQHAEMLRAQKGKCAMCGAGDKLVVDHNHTTDKVRGLICTRCNLLLGFTEDLNPELLARAAKYLETH